MKTLINIGIGFCLVLQTLSNSVQAQCKSFLKRVDFSALEEYAYCGEVQIAQMYNSDSAEVQMKLSSKTKYRILLNAQEYLGEIQMEVVNGSNELISIAVEENNKRYWEVFTDKKEKVDFKIKFLNQQKAAPMDHGIEAAGCVVLAVGKISLEEFVEASTESTDL